MALPVGNAGPPAIADGQAGGVRLVGVVQPVLGRQLPNRSPILRSLEPRGVGFAHADLTAGEVHVDLVFAVWRARQRSVTTERAAAEEKMKITKLLADQKAARDARYAARKKRK